MYIPSAFRGEDELAWRLMREYPFGMVITVQEGPPCISHVPLEVDAGGRRISWHLARQNPQCAQLLAGSPATVVFSGPHAYVSPAWYERPAVPTWNYVAVHVSGAPETMDEAGTAALVASMSRRYEGPGGLGAYENGIEYNKLRVMIRGFSLSARDLQCKLKLSQNRSLADQRAVARQLLASSRCGDNEIGRIMQLLLDQAMERA